MSGRQKECVILRHTGSKRGGWNVRWWLQGDPGADKWFPYRKEAQFLELRIACIPTRHGRLGPYATKQEAIAAAEERGWATVTPQKLAAMVRKRGADPHGL